MRFSGLMKRRRSISFMLAMIISLGCLFVSTGVTEASAENELNFTVLHTNDEHSGLVPFRTLDRPDEDQGGFARLSAAIKQVRKEKEMEGEAVILLSAGDFLGETAYGWLITREYAPEMEWLHKMKYDAVTVGNHEYDFGPDVLASMLLMAGYPESHAITPVLASNTHPPADHPLAKGLLRSSVLLQLDNGLKVGVFGLIGYEAVTYTVDVGDITFGDSHEMAREQVASLRGKGADVVVALTHSGLEEDIELANDVEGIHLIVGGHSHDLLEEPVSVGQTLIVQAGAQTTHLGQIELAFLPETQRLRVRNQETGRPFVLPVDGRIDPDPDIMEWVDGYTVLLNNHMDELTGGQFSSVHEPIVRSSFPLTNKPGFQETPMGNLVTDAMRIITEEVTGRKVDVAIQADGSIRGPLVPDSHGNLTFYDVTNTIGLGYGKDGYPGYSITSLTLTGEELRRVLEIASLMQELMGDVYFLQFSGLEYRYNPDNIVLMTLPILNQPIPTTRAVKEALLYRGNGIQPGDEGDYVTLEYGDDTLYHVVTDTYLLSFLPMAGELLPRLEVIPKDAVGKPVPFELFHQLTVPYRGRELKVWETAAMYVAGMSPDATGMPVIPDVYESATGRIMMVAGISYFSWMLIVLTTVAGALASILLRKKRKAKTEENILR